MTGESSSNPPVVPWLTTALGLAISRKL